MIAAYIIAYNDENIILDAIRSLRPCVDRIIAAVSDIPYHGQHYPIDKTRELATAEGCHVISGSWTNERDHRNTAMSEAEKNAELVVVCESDMVYDQGDLSAIIHQARQSNARAFRARQLSYWRDREHILLGDQYSPVVAVKPGVRVTVCANVDVDTEVIDGVKVHHYNWCAPKDIKKKVLSYHHAPQIQKNWYEENYLTWQEGELARLPDCSLSVLRV